MPNVSIIVVIVALWAAVLVPALLRRHDEATESKSVDRFTRAMRTLRRDVPLPEDDHTVLMPRRPSTSVAPHIFSKGDVSPARLSPPRATASVPAIHRPSNAALLARRRRALLVLLVAAGISLVGGFVAGGEFWAAHGLVDGLAVVYVAHLRAEAKRARALRRRRPAPRTAPVRRQDAARVAEAAVASGSAASRQVSFDDGTVTGGAIAEAAEASRAWQPIPVPPPTYVTAPKAPRRGKQIEVPVSWSDGLPDDEVDAQIAAAERVEPEIDRLIQRRRAVND